VCGSSQGLGGDDVNRCTLGAGERNGASGPAESPRYRCHPIQTAAAKPSSSSAAPATEACPLRGRPGAYPSVARTASPCADRLEPWRSEDLRLRRNESKSWLTG